MESAVSPERDLDNLIRLFRLTHLKLESAVSPERDLDAKRLPGVRCLGMRLESAVSPERDLD